MITAAPAFAASRRSASTAGGSIPRPVSTAKATIRAIQRAVAVFDRVLVGEVQASEARPAAIATAADAAYDAGAIFVSANGNFGPDASTVRSPGIAHKVLGVGAFMTLRPEPGHHAGARPGDRWPLQARHPGADL